MQYIDLYDVILMKLFRRGTTRNGRQKTGAFCPHNYPQ
jgi:hypothetical protein